MAEIFQWMTPEQSKDAHNDAVVREQIADEVADVLLYVERYYPPAFPAGSRVQDVVAGSGRDLAALIRAG